jgi:hypothetical protein
MFSLQQHNLWAPKTEGEPMTQEKKTEKDDLDWENRVLCSDEACIGVIGPDRRCRECGKLYEGPIPDASEAYALDDAGAAEGPDQDAPADQATAEALAPDTDGSASGPEDTELEDDWDSRILCSDGSCIGVIGPDGRCKDCGKPYEG